MSPTTYAATGVDITAGHRATQLMKAAVHATHGPEVLAGVGSFGGLFDVSALKGMTQPILVASTDGVGTKTKVASRLNRWDTIGHDIVNHCVNDILVQGARPLFFLDYVASARLDPEQIATVVRGVAEACQYNGCALLGGETAEMPTVYHDGALDLVGTVVGVVDRPKLIDGSTIEVGDIIIGLPSTGAHTNGYTLLRHIFAEQEWQTPNAELGTSLGEALLAPHRSYLHEIGRLQSVDVAIRGLAHITGGGIIDNLPRILPKGCGAHIQRGTWPVLSLFDLAQRLGNIAEAEMFRVFNMGLGMLVVVPTSDVPKLTALLDESYVVGEIVAGKGVTLVG